MTLKFLLLKFLPRRKKERKRKDSLRRPQQTSENMELLPVQRVCICVLTVTVATATAFGSHAIAVFAYDGRGGRTRRHTSAPKQEKADFCLNLTQTV